MIILRPSDERGRAQFDWLDSRHTFSFGEYYDPRWQGFRSLRVINEDQVRGGAGFGTHPHRNMEIFTCVLSGAVELKDSMGNGSVIRPGEWQRLTAGTGITHSEFNPSPDEPLHLLQIWMLPERAGLTPGYEQRSFDGPTPRGHWRVVASPGGRDGALTLHQDAEIFVARPAVGEKIPHQLRTGRHAWVQVARGAVELSGHTLRAGDGAAISEESWFEITALEASEVLLFDLA